MFRCPGPVIFFCLGSRKFSRSRFSRLERRALDCWTISDPSAYNPAPLQILDLADARVEERGARQQELRL
jgi:hypothetical protein